ncbi:MAG: hypothetical protein IH800_13935 [Myxococcales bacterium]|nr:hypothetical protein [Myxococcales bacterium]
MRTPPLPPWKPVYLAAGRLAALAGLMLLLAPSDLGIEELRHPARDPRVAVAAPAPSVKRAIPVGAGPLAPKPSSKLSRVARLASKLRAHPRPAVRRKQPQRATRLALLEHAGLLERLGSEAEIAGVRHRAFRLRKAGLPIFNRRGRIHDGTLAGSSGHLSFPPLASQEARITRDEAVRRAIALTSMRRLWAGVKSERGWFATEDATVPAWQVTLPTEHPFGLWQATLDGRTGEPLALVDLARHLDGTGLVHDPNPVLAPTPSLVTLFDLDDSFRLSGKFTTVLDDRSVEAFQPDLEFVYPTDDPRFVQTSVYRGLTDTGRFAEAHGFPAFSEPLLAFTNVAISESGDELNDAVFVPGFNFFLFGNGDGVLTTNIGKDLDVAAHEMGHYIFNVLVDPVVVSSTDLVLAIEEGVADTLAALLGGDANIAESVIPGEDFLRTLANDRVFPRDLVDDPHETGLIFGGLNWDLVQLLGADGFADILIAGLPFLPPDAFLGEYPDALLAGDQLVNAGANAAFIQNLANARGLLDPLGLVADFKGSLEPGGTGPQSTADGEVQVWVFQKFPDSAALEFSTTGSGDVDLLVAPLEGYDPLDMSTFMQSFGPGSTESIRIDRTTSPSVDDADAWLVAVFDPNNMNGIPSSYELEVSVTLPLVNISIPGVRAASLDQPGEIDTFTFSALAGQVVRVEASGQTPGFDPLIGIVDPETFELLASDDDSGPGFDALIQGLRIAETGRYVILVSSPLGDIDPSSGTGSYLVSISLCSNLGTNLDGDDLVDDCDDDDDNDGFKDGADSAPRNATACSDIDRDLCDDCSSGSFDLVNDGPDADGDLICDLGDPDDDNDGCADTEDPAPFVPSPDQDLDLAGADCDPCPFDADDDIDADGLCADVDNCPALFNPNQDDVDGDLLGDACDPCPLDPVNADLDGDGVCVVTDNCPYTTNPDQLDSGGFDTAVPNTIGDGCECGDVNGDGVVDLADIVLLRRTLFGLPPGLAAPEKCRVSPLGSCNDIDVDVLRRALAGLLHGIEQLCFAAIPRVSVDLDGAAEWLANASEQPLGIANVWTLSIWIQDRSFDTKAANYVQLFRLDRNSVVNLSQLGNGGTNPLTLELSDTSGAMLKDVAWNNVMSPAALFHHLVLIWDGTDGGLGLPTLYVDGELRPASTVTTNAAGTLEDSPRSVFIGGTASLDGRVGHTAFWDVALAPEEIAQIFDLGHAIDLRSDGGDYLSSSRLKHYWRPGQIPSAIGLDAVPTNPIDIASFALNLTYHDDVVFEGPE